MHVVCGADQQQNELHRGWRPRKRARFARSANERELRAARNNAPSRNGGLAYRPAGFASIAMHLPHVLALCSRAEPLQHISCDHLEPPDRGKYTEKANNRSTYRESKSIDTCLRALPEKPRSGKKKREKYIRVSFFLLFLLQAQSNEEKNASLSTGQCGSRLRRR